MRAAASTRAAAASSHARPSATIPGTPSVPGRSPRSCPPPNTSGRTRAPFFSHSAPTPLGPWILCAEIASESNARVGDVDGELAERLHGVDVHVAARRARLDRARDRLDRLHRAELVLHPHARRPAPCPAAPPRRTPRRATTPLRSGATVGHLDAALGERLGRVRHRRVLERAHDDVRWRAPRSAEQRQRVGLGAARREGDLGRRAAERRRHLLARPLQAPRRLGAELVRRRRVAPGDEHRLHRRLGDPLVDPGGRAIIEIDFVRAASNVRRLYPFSVLPQTLSVLRLRGARARAHPARAVCRRRARASSPIVRRCSTGARLTSVYFGGGTPGLWRADCLGEVLAAVRATFPRRARRRGELEVTVEANPDDLPREQLDGLRAAGVTRLSLGVQSLEPKHLATARAHARRAARPSAPSPTRAPPASAPLARSHVRHAVADADRARGRPRRRARAWSPITSRSTTSPSRIAPRSAAMQRAGLLAGPRRRACAPRCTSASTRALTAAGFGHYEISSWARPGPPRRAQHALLDRRRVPRPRLLGALVPPPARRRRRALQRRALRRRMAALRRPVRDAEETLDAAALEREAVWLGLRLLDGIDRAGARAPARPSIPSTAHADEVGAARRRRAGRGHAPSGSRLTRARRPVRRRGRRPLRR